MLTLRIGNSKMENNGLKYFLITLLVLVSLELYTQESEIGLNIGYGATVVDDYGIAFVPPFYKETTDFLRFGFCYYYSPKHSIFSLKTGIDYDYRAFEELKLNYLRIPFGLDFNIGKKIQFIIGAGLFTSCLIAYSELSENDDFANSLNRFQLGWYGNIGLGIKLSQNYNLSIKYQYNADMTKMYEGTRYSPGGAKGTIDKKGYDSFIIMCLKFKLANH